MSTIAAIATAMGEGGIAVVRLSGPESESILRKTFKPFGQRRAFESHRLMYGHCFDGHGQIVDECMAVLMRVPHSYTREDVAEIHCHGGRMAAVAVMRRVLELGARAAERGEFTRRAFENGRIDLSEAEAVMNVVSAGSEAGLRASVRALEGGASSFINDCRRKLTDLLSLIEAGDDFPEELDEDVLAEDVAEGAAELRNALMARVDEKKARAIMDGVSVVLCGRPNVGKSSLMNAILGHERAIVTEIPGTTRDILTENIELQGIRVALTDTAGQRSTEDQVERLGVERARRAQQGADVILMVIDASVPLTEEDHAFLQDKDDRTILILNKIDIPCDEALMTDIHEDVRVCARTGEGVDELIGLIRDKIGAFAPDEGLLLTERHMRCARSAAEHLDQAIISLRGGAPSDVAAVDLWDARRTLGEITGEDATDAVIDAVFSNFCVGK